MQINNALSQALAKFSPAHKPALPSARTPVPQRNKVVSPVRVPVNKQAAMLIQPVRSWVCQPPPLPQQKLPTAEQKEIEKLTAELKSERNRHAETRDELGRTRGRLKHVMAVCTRLDSEVVRLKENIREKEQIIRQLEDIKL